MKHIIIFVLIFLASFTSNAQNEITGKIVDLNNVPVAFSNIILKNTESQKIITGTTSNEEGYFHLELSKGSYLFEVSFMGYETLTTKIKLDTKQNNLGKIVLTQNTNSLNQIIIKGEKPVFQQKADRLTFNVQNSIMATGGNIVDALKVTPGLQVSDNGINLIGKGQIRAMVNGRLVKLTGDELISYLTSIPAENISKIEVIDTPPAKYEAEGNGGLINIVYKKGIIGQWNTNLNGSYRQGVYALYSFGANTVYNDDKLSIAASIDLKKGRKELTNNSIIFYPTQVWSTINKNEDNSKSINGRLALDYQYSKKSSIGFQYLGTVARPYIKYNGSTIIRDYNNEIDSLISSKNTSNNENYNHSINLHHESNLDSLGKSLSFEFDYFKFNDQNELPIQSDNLFPDREPTGNAISALNNSDQKIENFSSKVDVELPYETFSLSFGGKLSFTKTINFTNYLNNDQGTLILVPDQNNNFEYNENVQALYATANKSFGKKWSAVFGLRLENTQTKGTSRSLDGVFNESNDNSYLKLFPTAYVSYSANEDNNFNLRYSRRISRPDFWELNPYKQYINAYIYSQGNPFLKPSFSHNIQAAHSYKNKLSSSVFVSILEEGYGQVPRVDNITGEQFYTRDNYFSRTSYGVSEGYSAKPFSWWRSYNQIFAFYHDVEFLPNTNLDTKPLDGFGMRYSSFNTFNLDQKGKINAEMNFWYAPGSSYQLYESTDSSGLDIGLKWSPNENIELSATINDIFNQNNPSYKTFTGSTKQIYEMDGGTRYFRLSLNYRIGNRKIKKREREFGNKEEQDRAFKY